MTTANSTICDGCDHPHPDCQDHAGESLCPECIADSSCETCDHTGGDMREYNGAWLCPECTERAAARQAAIDVETIAAVAAYLTGVADSFREGGWRALGAAARPSLALEYETRDALLALAGDEDEQKEILAAAERAVDGAVAS